MKDVFRTALTMGTLVGATLGCAPVACGLALRDEELPNPVIRLWARSILGAAGVRAVLRIPDTLPPHFVMALNHQSNFDVLMLYAHVPAHLRFVAKAELFKIPLFGATMGVLGHLKVDRKGSEQDRTVIRDAARAVRERVNIVFFAEGTRSPDGVLRPFKKGAASLAIEAGVPILPAAVSGTGNILPKGQSFVHSGQRAALVIGEPIPTTGLTQGDTDSLTQTTHAAVANLLLEAEALRKTV